MLELFFDFANIIQHRIVFVNTFFEKNLKKHIFFCFLLTNNAFCGTILSDDYEISGRGHLTDTRPFLPDGGLTDGI
jgi:hypothetical protein